MKTTPILAVCAVGLVFIGQIMDKDGTISRIAGADGEQTRAVVADASAKAGDASSGNSSIAAKVADRPAEQGSGSWFDSDEPTDKVVPTVDADPVDADSDAVEAPEDDAGPARAAPKPSKNFDPRIG